MTKETKGTSAVTAPACLLVPMEVESVRTVHGVAGDTYRVDGYVGDYSVGLYLTAAEYTALAAITKERVR